MHSHVQGCEIIILETVDVTIDCDHRILDLNCEVDF